MKQPFKLLIYSLLLFFIFNCLSFALNPSDVARKTINKVTTIHLKKVATLNHARGQKMEINSFRHIFINKGRRVLKDEFIKFNNSSDSNYMLYPNPANNSINLNFEMESRGSTELMLFDYGMKVALCKRLNFDKGNNNISADVTDLCSGTYYFMIHGNDKIISGKFDIVK